ncbi:MAG: hypothetical protein CVU16_07375 [Betaproteobacteria bacterium HGW-Betaproteobacteria-10]|jgi:flagellar FliL protein|nr:MAG: hypothetical protein CVU16_07375 [Betaproteobacteria bacterium HGW-Betaproteobacteria-10]
MRVPLNMAQIFRVSVFCLLTALPLHPAIASDHGGGGGPEPLLFTVNLGTEHYLQFGVILQTATPEVAHEIAVYRPKIQNEIILLISGKTSEQLRTLKGKEALIEEIIALANHVIHETEKTGVHEALFTNFIIQ